MSSRIRREAEPSGMYEEMLSFHESVTLWASLPPSPKFPQPSLKSSYVIVVQAGVTVCSSVGTRVGLFEGVALGTSLGTIEGIEDGCLEGSELGADDGSSDGAVIEVEGVLDGESLGAGEGRLDGSSVGIADGTWDGVEEGKSDSDGSELGLLLGEADGSELGSLRWNTRFAMVGLTTAIWRQEGLLMARGVELGSSEGRDEGDAEGVVSMGSGTEKAKVSSYWNAPPLPISTLPHMTL